MCIRDRGHAVERDVGKRMPERGELPVEHRDDARLGWVEHQVAHAEIAVTYRRLAVFWNLRGEPLHKTVEPRVVACSGRLPMPRPARDLAREIVARLAEVGEAHARRIHTTQPSHH